MNNNNINSDDWIERLAETKLYKLAKTNLIRTNKVKKAEYAGINFYDFDPVEVILEGFKIIKKANRARIKL